MQKFIKISQSARTALSISILMIFIMTFSGCRDIPAIPENKVEKQQIKTPSGENSMNTGKEKEIIEDQQQPVAESEKALNTKTSIERIKTKEQKENENLLNKVPDVKAATKQPDEQKAKKVVKPLEVQRFNDNKPAEQSAYNLIKLPAPSDERGNTYARGMSTVLSFLGKDFSYDQVMGLTGVAFILQLDTNGPYLNGELDCAWWPNDAWGFNLGLPILSKACGWDFRQLRCDYKAYQSDAVAAYQKSIAPEMAKSLKAGRPVLAEYDHCFIVTGADNGNPPLMGYGTIGASTRFKDVMCMSNYPWAAIVFEEKITPLKQSEVDIASLQYIIALFDEKAQVNPSGSRFSGKQAWEEWLKMLNKGMACDNNMLIHLRYNRGCAVTYLKELAKRFSGKTADQINAAAKLYQQALGKLKKQELPWGLIQGGKPEQEVRAEFTKMVKGVFKLETKAINHLRKALKSEGVDMKEIEDPSEEQINPSGKKIIEGVPPIAWRKTGDCSYAAALEAALKPTEHPYSYTDIMGYTALAFRTRWRGLENKRKEPWWCGSIPVGEFEIEVNKSSEMTGWEIKSTGMFENEPKKIKEYIPEVIKSINRGTPVVAYPTKDNLNCGVIYGYEMKDSTLKFYWRDLFKGDKKYMQDAEKTGPMLFFLKSWEEPVPAKERFLSSLTLAVYNWSREPLGTPSYYTWTYGKNALEIWADDLKHSNIFPKPHMKQFFFVNAWNYTTLRDARKQAVKYLTKNKKLLSKDDQKKLDKAIDLYKQEVELLVPNSDLFKGPMEKKELKDWTQDERDKAAEIMELLVVLETQAMNIIDTILHPEKAKISADQTEESSLSAVLNQIP